MARFVLGLALPAAALAAPDPLNCLQYVGDGCGSILDQQTCLSSRDGSKWKQHKDVPVQGQRCVWCGGGPCTDRREVLCESFEYIQWWAGHKVSKPNGTQVFTPAKCTVNDNIHQTLAALPAPMLLGKCEGCEDEERAELEEEFAQMDGADRACRGWFPTDTGATGTPVVYEGVQTSYSIWTAATLSNCKALCKEGCTAIEYKEADKYCEVWHQPVQYTAAAKGFQCFRKKADSEVNHTKHLSTRNTECLKEEDSCFHLLEQRSCLSSKQATGEKTEPCVWCGGGLCSTTNASLCQPLSQLASNSYGSLAVSTFKVAGCKAGEPTALPAPPMPAATTAAPAPVEPADACAETAVAGWASVAGVCGPCKAAVTNMAATFPTCHDYCAQQAEGMTCVNAWETNEKGCEIVSIQSCDRTFDLNQTVMCECKAASGPSAKGAKQMRYLQCGGNGWTGLTACELGTTCYAANEYFSSCIPDNEVPTTTTTAETTTGKPTTTTAATTAAAEESLGAGPIVVPVVAPVVVPAAEAAQPVLKPTAVTVDDAAAPAAAPAQGKGGLPWWGWTLIAVGALAVLVPVVLYATGFFSEEKRRKRATRGVKLAKEAEPEEVEAPLVPQAGSAPIYQYVPVAAPPSFAAVPVATFSQVQMAAPVATFSQVPLQGFAAPVATFHGGSVQYSPIQ